MANYDVGGGAYYKVRWQTTTWEVGPTTRSDGELQCGRWGLRQGQMVNYDVGGGTYDKVRWRTLPSGAALKRVEGADAIVHDGKP
jgi:hypothetical protein